VRHHIRRCLSALLREIELLSETRLGLNEELEDCTVFGLDAGTSLVKLANNLPRATAVSILQRRTKLFLNQPALGVYQAIAAVTDYASRLVPA
jgi:hypothetical protein